MAWTTPPTFASSTTATASDANILSSDLAYLKALADGQTLSAVKLHRTSSQSIPDATDTDITWQAEDADIGSWWSSGTTITVPASAVASGGTVIALCVVVAIRFVSNAAGGRAVKLLHNGSEVDQSYGGTSATTVTSVNATFFIFDAAAADTIKIQALQNSGGALNMDTAKVTIVRIAQVS